MHAFRLIRLPEGYHNISQYFGYASAVIAAGAGAVGNGLARRALSFAAQRAAYGADLYDAASGIVKAVGTTEGGLIAADGELFGITADAIKAAHSGQCTGDLKPLLTLQW